MLLVFERFFQQSWHTIFQPSSLWLAPRVLTPSPLLPHSAHVPMLFGLWVGWLLKSHLGGSSYSNLRARTVPTERRLAAWTRVSS